MNNQDSNQSYKSFPANHPLALQKINQQNRKFWFQENKLRDERISDEVIFKIATREMRSEAARFVQIRERKSFEEALADAESTQRLVLSNFSRKGGRTRKLDSLQGLILDVVRGHPTITQTELLAKLREQVGEGVISSIDRKSEVLDGDNVNIHFFNVRADKEKTARISGLKDRLRRAKKYFRANR